MGGSPEFLLLVLWSSGDFGTVPDKSAPLTVDALSDESVEVVESCMYSIS
jgi:hypothetical protein